jgi:hypothetical protein
MSINVDIRDLDGHLGFLRNEISVLRRQDKPWAETKADRLEKIMVIISDLRREKLMTSISGKRIDE